MQTSAWDKLIIRRQKEKTLNKHIRDPNQINTSTMKINKSFVPVPFLQLIVAMPQ